MLRAQVASPKPNEEYHSADLGLMLPHQVLAIMQAIMFRKKEHHVAALLIFWMRISWKLATCIDMPWTKRSS